MLNNTLVQDDKSPYHYLRELENNRLIFGGEDTKFNNKVIDDKQANKKYKLLEKKLKQMFRELKNFIKVDYKFCGVFASTNNNLGLIGKTENPNLLYFLSVGANGIINAMAGVETIESILQNKSHPLEKLFSPTRLL